MEFENAKETSSLEWNTSNSHESKDILNDAAFVKSDTPSSTLVNQ